MKFNTIYLLYSLLIIFNSITIYYIIELSGYDEMLRYQADSSQHTEMPRVWIIVFLVAAFANLLFIAGSFMRSIVFLKQYK